MPTSQPPKWYGFNFPSWWNGVYGSSAADASLGELRSTAGNSVAITPSHFVDSVTGSVIQSTQQTESEANVRAIIADARDHGLDVVLKPHLEIANWAGSRLDLAPSDPQSFFDAYTDLMVGYAQVAEETGVALLTIGTELSSMTTAAYTPYWNNLISDVRSAYSGKITYAANWGEESQVQFWDRLDYIGVDFYAPLTENSNPTQTQLFDALNTAPANGFTANLYGGEAPLRYYENFAASHGKPLIFTEVGWTEVDGGNMQWSNSVQNPGIDPQEQADAFAAFLDALSRPENSYVDGALIWAWGPQIDPQNPYSFNVDDNPAEGVIRDAFTSWAEGPPPPPASGPVVAEVGSLASVTQKPVTVQLDHSFVDPVVIVSGLSYAGGDVANVRILDIDSDRFTLRVQEAEYLDDRHAGETVNWMVVESGTWTLEDGTKLQAGKLATSQMANQGWSWVDFNAGFADTPAVLSHVQTNNDPTWVVTRQRDVDTSHFRVALQEEEALTSSGHGTETIGYLALDRGPGIADGHDFIAQSRFDVNKNFTAIDFGDLFDTAPIFLSTVSTSNELDTVTARWRNLTDDGVQVVAQEDRSADTELNHALETVDYFAIEHSGLIHAAAAAGT